MTEPLVVAAELHLIGAVGDVATLAALLVVACPVLAVWLWRRT